jgi:energy-coupling factor transporter ATP-binding protein EcfA2
VASPPPGFPRSLLEEPWNARLAYFQRYTVAHPQLMDAKERLIAAIQNAEPNSLVFVFGPTGVGKTTLRLKTEQLLTAELSEPLEQDRGRLAVVSVEAVAPESGSFSWADHFKRLLQEIDEPLVDYKRDIEARSVSLRSPARPKPTTGDYRYAVEQALRFRRPAAVMIDEAQHLAKITSGRRLLDQLDVIKSIANRTQTVHVLYGTYDLLAFRNLNGQLSRRSIDVHFPRYRVEVADDRRAFIGVLRSFAQQLPLAETPDLASDWEFLYERSIGSVGVLKQWLVRALSAVLRKGEATLSRRALENQALSVSQIDKILSEASEGEMRLTDGMEAASQLRERLGLSSHAGNRRAADPSTQAEPTPMPRTRNRPGQRQPMRDIIGSEGGLNAAGV